MSHRCLSMGALVAALSLTVGSTTWAADEWAEVRSPNFTVVSNAGDRTARNVAWQLEQIRAAIAAGWPWARPDLDRPVLVIAARNEDTMKALAPQYWERRDSIRPTSVFVSMPDRHFILLRSDIRADDTNTINPYFSSYWSYSSLAIGEGFERELPLWFRGGLAAVLSNSIVREDELRFGLPIPGYLEELRTQGRLRLSELFAVDRQTPYYRNPATRNLFDAQAWGVMHYLLFGRPNEQADRVNALARLLLTGASSATAVREVFGDIEILEQAYLQHVRKDVMTYSRMKAETRIVARDFTGRLLKDHESAAIRASFHVAAGRAAEARALIAEARKGPEDPLSFDVEAMLLQREDKMPQARDAFTRAEQLGSQSFYTHLRLATLGWPETDDREAFALVQKRLERATSLNGRSSLGWALLANVLSNGADPARAMEPARRAVTLAPADSMARLSLARAFWSGGQRNEGMGHARAAMSLARSEEERQEAKEVVDFFTRASQRPN